VHTPVEPGLRSRAQFAFRQLRQRWRSLSSRPDAGNAPLTGHGPGSPAPFLDALPDAQLEELNAILAWNSFVVDGRGRRFGNVPWQGKGRAAEKIPNKRTRQMHQAFDLRGRSVLEIGCFEGAHTLGLCQLGAQVTAVDSRVENVVKTIVRTACFDHHPRVFVCDVERRPLPVELLRAEFCHHVGVFYHLADPVTHIRELGELIAHGILLDTHYAAAAEATERYEVGGESFAYQRYGEFGYDDVWSGMFDHSKWLTLDTILQLLNRAGFDRVLTTATHVGSQGPRATILVERSRP
jgi:SAM-dependent methyltransferase